MRDIGVGTTCRSKDQTDIWATLAFLWRERENIQSSVSVFKNGWLRTSLGLNKHVKKKKKKGEAENCVRFHILLNFGSCEC